MIHTYIHTFNPFILKFTVHFAHKLCAYQFYRFSFVNWISTSIIMIFVLLLLLFLLLSTSIFFSPVFVPPFLYLFSISISLCCFFHEMYASHVSQHSSVSNHSNWFCFVQLYMIHLPFHEIMCVCATTIEREKTESAHTW